jgi:diadenosine tetraphosphatase ApaH/serine/threonine PP2A family protein phosphatase
MRYGILSDVHGNLEALEVVLAHLQAQGVDGYAFLGDAVGYGANPNEVCNLLRPLVAMAVMGNHDAAVSGRMDYADYYEAARHALDWATSQLSDENHDWLKDLPFKAKNDVMEISHGAPIAPELFDYLFTAEQVVDLLDSYDELAAVTFIGHSHLTISFELKPDQVTPIMAAEIQLKPDAKYIITVGSVGQPRDRDPRSCCGIFDTEKRVFNYHRLEYPRELTRQKIISAGLAPVFGDRLLVGM